jgi:dTDP-glucose 4,6-dehydratase
MKILVYGSNGWIGSQFLEILVNNNVVFVKGNSRIDNINDLTKEIDEYNPTHIVSFIGRTHGKIDNKVYTTIDYLEQEGKLVENLRDNLFSPLVLAELSRQKNIHYTYLGTGCIFKFDDEHPFGKEENGFTEDSLPNFFGSSYSVVKGFTDRLMHLYKDNVLNLRIRMPITGNKNSRNFITKITTYNKVCSVPNSMTILPELLPCVLKMMEQKYVGTINLTNPGLISHNEILQMYKDIVDPSFTWNNFTIEEQRKILAADRSNNYLETIKLSSLFPEIKNIKDSVYDCLVEYKKSIQNEVSNKNHNNEIIEDNDTNKINLLVTGGCGFIGSNFINYYFPKNKIDKLINFDAMYYCANENNVNENIRNNNKYSLIKDNLKNSDSVKECLEKFKITHVIHFAAQSHVQNSFEDSIKFTYDNILGTHTLLECCRKYGKIQKFIHVSTDEVYGESMNSIDEQHKTEHSILCPTNPYAATKAGAELIAQSYNHSYKMPIIITRGNNVYGPNQYPEKLIPLFIKLLNENKKVTIQGDGSSVRAFLHAYDTAKAFETILEKGNIGEIYNIGCDEKMEYSVLDISKILIKMIKNTENYEDWIQYIEDRPYNDMRYYISNEKLKKLGWDIEIDLETGLKDLINNTKISPLNLFLTEKTINKKDFFGDWIKNEDYLNELHEKFIKAEPFEHIIIPNFLNTDYANIISDNFPNNFDNWYKYNNPLEVKYAYDNINQLPEPIKNLFYILSTNEITNIFSKLTSVDNLEYDPFLHGAGLHSQPKNGRLHMHLDYEKHPLLNKERRLNIIIYLNKEWKNEWNGQTELWDKNMENCITKSEVKFNNCIIFKTNNDSWHGIPEKINCPDDQYRKTIAYYYISPLKSVASDNKFGNSGNGYRVKASYKKRPCDNKDNEEKMDKLYKIRPHRLITKKDMDEIWSDWNPEDY